MTYPERQVSEGRSDSEGVYLRLGLDILDADQVGLGLGIVEKLRLDDFLGQRDLGLDSGRILASVLAHADRVVVPSVDVVGSCLGERRQAAKPLGKTTTSLTDNSIVQPLVEAVPIRASKE